MPALRSLLFVPGNRANMLQKAMGSAPDAFIPDLEDSVPIDEKTQARDVTASFLSAARRSWTAGHSARQFAGYRPAGGGPGGGCRSARLRRVGG